MFTSREQIRVVERIDHLAQKLTPEQIEELYKSEQGDLMLESVTLEELENTLLFQCDPVPQMMLEAFKAKASQLAVRVKKFANQLERQTPNLTCGDVEISNPRKSGAVAVQVAKIPLSDGQSVSIAFHAPDNDPLKINADDTLIAFRFLLNSRDVTHTVAPKGGQDISLKEATTKLGDLAERNSEKFQAAQAKKKAEAKELEETQAKIQELEEETASLNEDIDTMEEQLAKANSKINRLQTQIDTQNEIQEELRKQLNSKPISVASDDIDSRRWQVSNRISQIDNLLRDKEKELEDMESPFSGSSNPTGMKALRGELAELRKERDALVAEESQLEQQSNDDNVDSVVALFRDPKLKAASDKALKVEGGKRALSTLSTIADIDVNGAKGMDRSLFVSNFASRIKTLHKNGNQEAVDAILTMVAAYNDVAPKAAVTARNGIWKLGNIQSVEEPEEQEEVESDDNLFWYGLRARPYGMGTTPSDYQPVKVIDDDEASKQFAHVDFRMIRHGAIAYDQALPVEVAEQFELPLLLGKDEHNEQEQTKEMRRIVKLALDDYMLDEDLDFYTQEKLDELKARRFKDAFANQLREQDEFASKSQLPEKFKKWNKLVEQVTPEVIQSVAEAESFIAQDEDEPAQLNETQKRMMFIANAEERLSNIENLSPKERKGAVMLASHAIRGISKTPKKGEGVSGQAARIAKQMELIKSLQGETYNSLDAQFKNVSQIKTFLAENNIPYTKLGATRKSLIESIIGYRDEFYTKLNNIVDKNRLQKDVMSKFERGESIPLEDVERGFGSTSVYRMGDAALAKELNSPVVPAEDLQGEEYKRVDRLITAIMDGEYPDLSHYSNQEVFTKYFEYVNTTMIDIKYVDGKQYLREHEKLSEDEAKVVNSYGGSWFIDAIIKEAEKRGLPDLNMIDSALLRSGEFADAERKHFDVVGTIGQNNASVINVMTGKVVEGNAGLSGAEAVSIAQELNKERSRKALDTIYNKLMSGSSIDELAASEMTPIAAFSKEMLSNLNGFEVAFEKLAQVPRSVSKGNAVLRKNAENFIHLFKSGDQFDLDELTDEQRQKMTETYGINEGSVTTQSGEKHKVLSIRLSKAYLTTSAVQELWKLLGATSEITSDDADETTKGKTEDEKLLLSLDPNEFTSGSIYESEGIGDVKTIASRVRSFVRKMREAGQIPNDVKISVRKEHHNSLRLSLTDLPDTVSLYNPAYLQFLIDNPESQPFTTIQRYSDEVTNLIEFVNSFVDQFNYNNSDTMTDYFDVNFYGGRLDVDWSFANDRQVQELESLTEIHQKGDEPELPEIDSNGIRDSLDDEGKLQLEQLEAFTNFKLRLGKQEITLPNGKTKRRTISNEDDVEWVISEFHDDLAVALEEKSEAQLENLTNWQSDRYYYGDGFQGHISIGKSLNSNYSASDSIDGLYGRKNLTAAIGTKFMRIYPIVKSGEFKFAAYSDDNSKHFGDFTNHSELEMLCIFALALTDKQPAQGDNEEMEHADKLRAIRDFTGSASLEQLEQFQTELESAYAYFQKSGTYAEHEALMEAAFANYVALQDQVAA